jgi:hypothetical protein
MSTTTAGLLDSGVNPAVASTEWPRRSFGVDGYNDDGTPDILGHGTALARIILAGAPPARLAVARIFTNSFACTPAAAAAGLDWLVVQGARVVNMSFGLREDRAVLREACERAAAAGVILLASAPARGPGVYPSSYAPVIRISGDARLRPGEASILGGMQADFGACPQPMEVDRTEDKLVGGASFAVAHATAIALRFLGDNPGAGAADLRDYLTSIARFHGPERRTAEAPPATPEGDSPCSP